MFKDGTNGKYSKFLTILLIIIIVLIIGLLAFLGIDLIKKSNASREANNELEEFEKQQQNKILTNSIMSNSITNSEILSNEILPIENIIQPENPNTNTQNGGSTGSGNAQKDKPYWTVGTIEIPKTNCKYPIYNKATVQSIDKGVGILVGVGLNKVGNTVIEGHNYRNGLFFSNNKKLEKGDKIYITDENNSRVTYTIYEKFETTPEDTSYLQRDTKGKREITLLTCTDNSKKRIIIFASAD